MERHCRVQPIDQILVLRLHDGSIFEGFVMETVTVSPKFQVVIPKRVREQMGLQPGQKLDVVQIGQRIELIQQQPPQALRGLLRGINTKVEREQDRV